MGTTARAGITYDALTNLADLPAALKTPLDQIDNLIGAPDCTSTTRPTTGLYAGRFAYETDTRSLIRYSGTAWEYVGVGAWRSFTPTLTNLTASATDASYRLSRNGVDFRVQITLAAAPTGVLTIGLPVASRTYQAGIFTLGSAFMKDASAGQYWMGQAASMLDAARTITNFVIYLPSSTTNNLAVASSTTAPFTLAAGDTISVVGSYETA